MCYKVTRQLSPTACRKEAEKEMRRCKIQRKKGLMLANRRASKMVDKIDLEMR